MNKFILFLLFATITAATQLVFVQKPSGYEGTSFYAKLTKSFDVRGDFGTFVLIVDSSTQSENVVFHEYDVSVFTYFVAEDASGHAVQPLVSHSILSSFQHKSVLGKYVFAVENSRQGEFFAHLPRFFELVRVAESALPAPALDFESVNVVDPDPIILGYVNQVTGAALVGYVTYLSGEASKLITRQAQSEGAVLASQYLQQKFTEFGFNVQFQTFRTGFSPNVVATLEGQVSPKRLLLVTAHYDDRASNVNSPTDRAPGANDNGSGTGALLQIAQLIHDNKISFDYTVVLIAFSGEEQGLYGSDYAARQYLAAGADIVAVLNSDMIAYRNPTGPARLDFVTGSATLSLNTVLANISRVYVEGLTIGTTSACCTDHSSFYSRGYPATSYCEGGGYSIDPQYHKVTDVVARADYDAEVQYPGIVKSVFAAVLTLARYQ